MLKRLSRIALVSMIVSLCVCAVHAQDAPGLSNGARRQSVKMSGVETGQGAGRKPTVVDVENAGDDYDDALIAPNGETPSGKTIAAPSSSVSSSSPSSVSSNVKPNDKENTPAAASKVSASPSKASVPPSKTPAAPATSPAVSNTAALAPTAIYRIGEGDVLDIRIANINEAARGDATFHTVMSGGTVDYPLIGEPLTVANLTTEEVDLLITKELKRRAILSDPQVLVSVREYSSHVVMVSGLVDNPGTKVLRREALPLYVVLAEAQPRPEAGRADILSADGTTRTIDLADATSTTILVYSGDVVRVVAAPPPAPQFFFIGGEVASPGQKNFHKGLTLTQAILAAGGATRSAASDVRVLRTGKDNLLVTTGYDLKSIEAGKIPDPVLEAGDRVELGRRGRWR